MNKLYQQSFIKYKNNPDKTCDVIGVMNAHVKPETAALVMVANAMLNLDEVIMKN
jgi:ferritin-like protein